MVIRLPHVVFSVVDVETTGLSSQQDRVTEIAIVQIQNERIVHTYTSLINPCCPIPPFIQHMTGITDAMVQVAPKFDSIQMELTRLLQGTVLVAHNARFDESFLRAEFSRCDCVFPQLVVVDTVALARRTVKGLQNYRLETLCRHFDLTPGGHRALGDALATAELLLNLIRLGATEKLAKHLSKVESLGGLL